jgi:hypothetical protein
MQSSAHVCQRLTSLKHREAGSRVTSQLMQEASVIVELLPSLSLGWCTELHARLVQGSGTQDSASGLPPHTLFQLRN